MSMEACPELSFRFTELEGNIILGGGGGGGTAAPTAPMPLFMPGDIFLYHAL